jgi:hypothetical protein
MRTLTHALLLLLGALTAQGCVWVAKLDYSVAKSQGSEWRSSNQNEFSFNGVKILVIPSTLELKGAYGLIIPIIPFWESFDKNPFATFLRISPGEQTSPLYLVPQHIRLNIDGNTLLTPYKVTGPFPHSTKDGCLLPEKESEETPLDKKIVLSETACVALLFDHKQPRPGQIFSITIESLTSDKPITPLHLIFEETKSQWKAGLGKADLNLE